MQYRRAFIPGGSFFFTVVTEKRQPLLASAAAVDVLREAFRVVRAKRPFEIDAAVVLPDHLHCIWTLPLGDSDFATRWRLVKTWFTKQFVGLRLANPTYGCLNTPNRARVAKRQRAVWQHRYWEHVLQDEDDFTQHVEYIHFNPVKHGLALSAMEWPFSSFRRFVEMGVYPADWGLDADYPGVGHE
jgi:putative transposase